MVGEGEVGVGCVGWRLWWEFGWVGAWRLEGKGNQRSFCLAQGSEGFGMVECDSQGYAMRDDWQHPLPYSAALCGCGGEVVLDERYRSDLGISS